MGQWQSQEVCMTPACIHASSLVLQNLHPNWQQMDPCTDFEQMMCYGTYEHSGVEGGTMGDIQKRTTNILRKILESHSHAEAVGVKSTLISRANADEYNFDMLRTAYQACMDLGAVQAAGVEPLTDLIISVNKTWPVSPLDLNTKLKSSDLAGLHKATLAVADLGVNVFHSQCDPEMPAVPDYRNSKLNRVCFQTPKTFLKSQLEVYLKADVMEVYTGQLETIFGLVYPDLDSESAQALAEAVVNFEIDFAKTYKPYEDASSGFTQAQHLLNVKNVTLADIGKTAPVFAFDKLITALSPKGKAPSVMLLDVPEFWPQWSNVVANHSRAAVQGFIVWQTVQALIDEVEDAELYKILNQRPPSPTDRYQKCILSADKQLRHILDSYFVKATYPDLAMKAADKMTTNIKKQLMAQFSESDWLSEDAKKRALTKAERTVQSIGYPTENPDLRSAESLRSYYAGVNMTSSHFANVLSARQHATAQGYADAAKPHDRHYLGDIKEVNAFYQRDTNKIAIPAGIAQLPIFHHHLPNYVLYGGLGAVVGHEFSHGFDNNGRQFSEDAELEDWWDQQTIDAFQKRAQCFVKQYSKYEVEVPTGKAHVNGSITLGENLADAGGLRASYDAWAAERKAMPSSWDQSLPGLESFTHEQLFFVFYAHMWCSAESPAHTAQRIERGPHSPPLIRIKGGTENSKAFREAFKCKVKEPKCELF